MNRESTHKPIGGDIEEQAMHWLVELSDDKVSDSQQARFEDWLATAPEHRAAYQSVSQIWSDSALVEEMAEIEPRYINRTSSIEQIWNAWRRVPVIAGSVAIALLAVVFLWPQVQRAEYSTGTGEVREVRFHDGTMATIGARSQLVIEFTNSERHVTLSKGEVYFNVAPDVDRPMVVAVRDTQVTVIGTQFNVHTGPDQVTVAVSEGVVEVAKSELYEKLADQTAKQSQVLKVAKKLTAGQRIVSTRGNLLGDIDLVSPDEVGGWRLGERFYDRATLRQVIADANRYSREPIFFATEDLGSLIVTAGFHIDRIEQLLGALEHGLPIELDRDMPGRIVIREKRKIN